MRRGTPVILLLVVVLLADVARQGPGHRLEGRPVPGREVALRRALTPATAQLRRSMVRIVAQGRGVVALGLVTAPREVLTSAHVHTSAGLSNLLVEDPSGDFHSATLKAVDDNDGLLLLEVSHLPTSIPSARLQTPTGPVARGSFAVSVGMAEQPIAVGIISALDRTITGRETFTPIPIRGFLPYQDRVSRTPLRYFPEVFQHDGLLRREELGSAVAASDGSLLGLNVSNVLHGTSYAIHVQRLRQVLPILRAGRHIPAKARGFLGIETRPAPVELLRRLGVEGAVVVRGLLPGYPAAAAGLQAGDVILAIEDRPILDHLELVQTISARRPGEEVAFTVAREGEIHTISVPLAGVSWGR